MIVFHLVHIPRSGSLGVLVLVHSWVWLLLLSLISRLYPLLVAMTLSVSKLSLIFVIFFRLVPLSCCHSSCYEHFSSELIDDGLAFVNHIGLTFVISILHSISSCILEKLKCAGWTGFIKKQHCMLFVVVLCCEAYCNPYVAM